MKTNARHAHMIKFAVFSSFEEENKAESIRAAKMTPTQRLDEFSILQERVWGTKWTKDKMKRIASVEHVNW